MLAFQAELQRKRHISDWPIKIKDQMGKRTQTLDRGTMCRRPASRSRLFTVDVETGVLRVLFNEADSFGLVRCLFLKLDTLVQLRTGSSHSSFYSGQSQFALFCEGSRTQLVRDLQFFGNFSHGIAFISQNKNRPTTFGRKFFVSEHFEMVIEPTNADTPDTQLV